MTVGAGEDEIGESRFWSQAAQLSPHRASVSRAPLAHGFGFPYAWNGHKPGARLAELLQGQGNEGAPSLSTQGCRVRGTWLWHEPPWVRLGLLGAAMSTVAGGPHGWTFFFFFI